MTLQGKFWFHKSHKKSLPLPFLCEGQGIFSHLGLTGEMDLEMRWTRIWNVWNVWTVRWGVKVRCEGCLRDEDEMRYRVMHGSVRWRWWCMKVYEGVWRRWRCRDESRSLPFRLHLRSQSLSRLHRSLRTGLGDRVHTSEPESTCGKHAFSFKEGLNKRLSALALCFSKKNILRLGMLRIYISFSQFAFCHRVVQHFHPTLCCSVFLCPFSFITSLRTA